MATPSWKTEPNKLDRDLLPLAIDYRSQHQDHLTALHDIPLAPEEQVLTPRELSQSKVPFTLSH
jgi:hypothetical protein